MYTYRIFMAAMSSTFQNLEKTPTINQKQNGQINRDILLKCDVGLQQKETRATHTTTHMHLKHNVQ